MIDALIANELVSANLSLRDQQLLTTLLNCVVNHPESHLNQVRVFWNHGQLNYYVALNAGADSWHLTPLTHETNIVPLLRNLKFATGPEEHFAFTDLAKAWFALRSERDAAAGDFSRFETRLTGSKNTETPTLDGLHQAIIEASGRLYSDGHYHFAVMRALLAINEAVRNKSGSGAADGASLARHAFSPKSPILRLSNKEAEQQGFMELFAGAWLALRNPAGHRILDDSELGEHGAREWLSFASALMRLVESATLVTESDPIGSDSNTRGGE